ncbi:histidine phosphatase family protein [Microbacterium sp. JZ31]|uniref:histidine phosphatase family protein n=1 Tax=Microbacterium sp. JZ31 TaxID=1906274 RepID=UPI001931614C|nr:histidine phosphatase family protein [Microbacterium sp. JZ31]
MTARRILLVRHAMPAADAATPPREWPLSGDGHARAVQLRHRIPDEATLLCSDERKAIETLESATGRAPVIDARFGEVRRPGEPFDDQATARRRAWVEGRLDERHIGWESPLRAAARLDEAVRAHAGDPVIGTHGMILSAWLVSRGILTRGAEAGLFWASLGFPDLVDVRI